MFGIFKKQSVPAAKENEVIAHQPPGEIFPWPQGTILTAIDDITIALPMAIFGKDEPIGSVIRGSSDDMQIMIPKHGDILQIRLQPGMSVSLSKSSQARLVAEDHKPRRVKISGPSVKVSAKT